MPNQIEDRITLQETADSIRGKINVAKNNLDDVIPLLDVLERLLNNDSDIAFELDNAVGNKFWGVMPEQNVVDNLLSAIDNLDKLHKIINKYI